MSVLFFDTIAVHLFQSKLCSFLSAKLKGLTKIYYFLMMLAHSIKKGKILSTIAVIKMILVWTPSGTSLQHHMAKVYVGGGS
jgi:hypothetical protein